MLTPHFVISADNSFFHADWSGPLCYGHLDPETLAPVLHWKADLRAPPGHICRAWPSASGLTLAVFSPGESACIVLTMSPSGEQVSTQPLKAIGLAGGQRHSGLRGSQHRGTGAILNQRSHPAGPQSQEPVSELAQRGEEPRSGRADPAALAPGDIPGASRRCRDPTQAPTAGARDPPDCTGVHRRQAHGDGKAGILCELVNLDIKGNNVSFSLRGIGKDGGAEGNGLYEILKAAGHRCGSYSYW